MPMPDLIDVSINSVFPRTIMTSVTVTLIALMALFLFGGEVIPGFTVAMIWGVMLVGTYSTVFIATPILTSWLGTVRETARAPDRAR